MGWKSLAVSGGVPPQLAPEIRVCRVVIKALGLQPAHSPRLPVQHCSSRIWSWDLPCRGQGQRGDSPSCHQTRKSRGIISVPAMNPFGTGSPAALPCPWNREKNWNVFHSLFNTHRRKKDFCPELLLSKLLLVSTQVLNFSLVDVKTSVCLPEKLGIFTADFGQKAKLFWLHTKNFKLKMANLSFSAKQ